MRIYSRALDADEIVALVSGTSSVTSNIPINVIAVNDAPTLVIEPTVLNYVENALAVTVSNAISIADSDDALVTSATISLGSSYTFGDGVLSFVPQSGITGTFNASTGELSLAGSASVADYQAALRSVSFDSSSDDPDTATRSVEFTVSDGVNDSNTVTRLVSVVPVNDAPSLSGISIVNALYTENNAPLPISSSLVVADIDNTVLTGAVVQITSNHIASEDVLSFTPQPGISGSYNASNGTLTFSGVCLLYTSPSPRDQRGSRMPSSA